MKLPLSLPLLGLALVGSGCYQPPSSDHSLLKVSAAGEITLQGQPVERQRLQAALEAATAKGRTLVVPIQASPQAPVVLLEDMVGQAKAAHAVVAFVGQDR